MQNTSPASTTSALAVVRRLLRRPLTLLLLFITAILFAGLTYWLAEPSHDYACFVTVRSRAWGLSFFQETMKRLDGFDEWLESPAHIKRDVKFLGDRLTLIARTADPEAGKKWIEEVTEQYLNREKDLYWATQEIKEDARPVVVDDGKPNSNPPAKALCVLPLNPRRTPLAFTYVAIFAFVLLTIFIGLRNSEK